MMQYQPDRVAEYMESRGESEIAEGLRMYATALDVCESDTYREKLTEDIVAWVATLLPEFPEMPECWVEEVVS